jgi:DNA (cytosine-5)-methyltransferase 1
MTHGSLFSGIGGFDLAARWCGWTNVFQCEVNPFCRQVLKYHFPNTQLYEDIRTTDFTKHAGAIDVISGGFPCQPFSVAGKRRGMDDDRFLWPEMLRAVREVQPAWVVAENVNGLLTQQQGVVFERVLTDLEGEGYEVQPVVIPACAVGAPHRRDRIWIIAHRTDAGAESVQERENGIRKSEVTPHSPGNDAGRYGYGEAECPHGEAQGKRTVSGDGSAFGTGDKGTASDAGSGRQERRMRDRERFGVKAFRQVKIKKHIPHWRDFPTQPPVRWGDDGLSDRLVDITLSRWRNESIKAFGNAIVPQVEHQIFSTLNNL